MQATIESVTPTHMLRQMMLIRAFDEEALRLRLEKSVVGTTHPYIGQEAIAVGACTALRKEDRVVSHHRGHGHCIAKGADVARMMAELLGRQDGYCRGRGGSMHIADYSIGILGANGIVGAGLPIAAGSAFAAQMAGEDIVTVCFFGDGAVATGAFHEALNVSSLWQLPVVWVCENNQYAVNTKIEESLAQPSIAAFADQYNMEGLKLDGTQVEDVLRGIAPAVERARAGGGPTLVECICYRWGVHSQKDTPGKESRPAEEVEYWLHRDPVQQYSSKLQRRAVIDSSAIDDMRVSVRAQVRRAVEFAEQGAWPTADQVLKDVYS